MSSAIKNLAVLLLLLATLAFGYFLYLQNGSSVLNTQDEIDMNVSAEAALFLQRLNELKAITITNDIFVDPRFNALTDYSGEITSEPTGKGNPFTD